MPVISARSLVRVRVSEMVTYYDLAERRATADRALMLT